jgi:ABC-type glycerol-3-phosphate transport system substrate-binding protein
MPDRARTGALRGAAAYTRRQVLRYTAAASGALAGATLLRAPAFAAPVVQNGVITVYFQINWQQAWNDVAIKLCQEFTDQNFNAKHKGVRAIPQPWGNASGVIAQVLAGDPQAPAVVSSCCGDFPIALPMLERLDPWLQQDNLPRTLWSQGQLLTYQEPDGLYGVPAYTACQPLIYNQSLFDELGLKYPDPDWDYIEAEKIWRQLAGKSPKGHWRYASTIELQPGGFDAYPFMFHGWGQPEGQMDITHTKALFDTPKAIACGEWWYSLVWDKVFINRFGTGYPGGAAAMANDAVAMYQSAGNMLFEAVMNLRGLKWDVVPMPYWPAGRATNVQVDYYGMNATYPNKELAWELWKFVAASEATNRFLISTTLSFPNLMSMWDEWVAIVNAAAPATRGKQLQWWVDAAQKGYGYGQQFWKYNDAQAENIIGNIATKIWNHQMDVAEGFRLITQQVNAFEAIAAGTQAQQAALQKQDASLALSLFPRPVLGLHTLPGE